MKRIIVLTLGAVFFWCSSSIAEERYGDFVAIPETKSAILRGPITADTNTAFDSLLAAMPDMKVLALHSPGGQVISALDIAKKIHLLGVSTVILDSMNCASACSIISFAGSERNAKGKLGVHQLSASGRENLQAAQLVISGILDAFETFGVDARVAKHMLTTSPKDMYYFSADKKIDYVINRKKQLTALMAPTAAPKVPELKFVDFKPQRLHGGKPVFPDFKAERTRTFRTRIANAVKKGPIFAGRYTLVEIGCGTSCLFGILVDISNGSVFDFPLGGEENHQLEMTYAVDSTLLKAVWMDAENGNNDTCVKQDYRIDDAKLILLAECKYTVQPYGACTSYN